MIAALAVTPVLGFAFCKWRVVRIATRRTPETALAVARKIMIYGYVSATIIGLPLVLLLIGLSIEIAGGKEFQDVGAIAGATVILVGFGFVAAVVEGISFRLAGLIRNLVDDEHQNIQTQIDRCIGWVEITAWAALKLCLLEVAGMFPIMLPIVVVFTLFGVPALIWQRRRSRESQLLWALALAAKNGRRLSTEIRRHARAWGGFYACRLREFATYLESGRELGFALQMVPGILPRYCVATIRSAEETGTLPEELTEIATAHVNRMRNRFDFGSPAGVIVLTLGYLTACLFVVSFVMYFIVPKMKAIFEGFGTELPPLTEAFIAISDVFANYFYLMIWLPIPLIGVAILDQVGWQALKLRIFAWFYPPFDAAAILRHLAHSIERNRQMADALRSVANCHFRPTVQEAMARIYVDVESGNDPWTQFRRRRFLTTRDLAVIQTAQQVGNLPWALREIASLSERRLQYRMGMLLQIVRPIVIIGLGLCVAFICIAMFMPLVKLVNDLS